MYSSVLCADVRGILGIPVSVETDISDGMPGMIMVGYLASAVREAADRVRTALKNTGITLPPKKITVNLSPADTRKEGTGFDLAIAVSMMCSLGMFPQESIDSVLFLGELGLNGQVKRIRGVVPMVEMARDLGCRACILPKENLEEGQMISGITCIGVSQLTEVLKRILRNDYSSEAVSFADTQKMIREELDFDQIQGQETVKEAALIAAAGMLNLLMIGPPGSGKTMVAKRIPGILPDMSEREWLEVIKIYSISGNWKSSAPTRKERPFRSPHHTVTIPAMIGGGRRPIPGEVTMASSGCLFLDEITEFPKAVLEALRQPLEDQKVQISRTEGTICFPAKFMLVAAMNPCNCGYYPDRNRCQCTAREISRYLGKLSMPFLDRMDLAVEVPRIKLSDLQQRKPTENSENMKKKVQIAHEIQRQRYQGLNLQFNSQLRGKQIQQFCQIDPSDQDLLETAFERLHLTARSYHRILKTARTIADLEESRNITRAHLLKAICYRNVDRKFWQL